MREQVVKGGQAMLVVGAIALLAAGCSRDKAPMTACIGDKPAVERIEDVAPPNCPD
jgi:hypothetical protein